MSGSPETARAESPAVAEGLTEPYVDVTLSASVAGIVRTEFLKEGDAVSQGQPIIELDKELEELDAARRKLVMDRNRDDLASTRTLFTSTKAVSKDEMLKIETESKVSEIEYGMAVAQLEKRKIVSPIAGTIVEVFRHVGEACEAYEPLARVVDTKRCYAVAYVSPKDAGAVKVGQPISVELDLGEGPARKPGTVSYLAPVVDSASGLTKVKALIDNADGRIRPGVRCRLILE